MEQNSKYSGWHWREGGQELCMRKEKKQKNRNASLSSKVQMLHLVLMGTYADMKASLLCAHFLEHAR